MTDLVPTPPSLAVRVLAAIEETEQRFTVSLETLRADLVGQAAYRIAMHTTPERARETAERIADAVMPSTATDIVADREAILRHCAADRKIVAIHLREHPFPKSDPAESYCVVCDADSYEGFASTTTDSWCETVRLVAEGYGITAEETP